MAPVLGCVQNNDLEGLKWMRARGYPWDDQEIFDCACGRSYLPILEYLKSEIGLFWRKNSIRNFKELETVTWALKNGCSEPEDWADFCEHLVSWSPKLVRWAIEERGVVPDFEFAIKAASACDLTYFKFIFGKLSELDDVMRNKIYYAVVDSGDISLWNWLIDEQGADISRFGPHFNLEARNRQSISKILWCEKKGILQFDPRMLHSRDPRIRKIGERLQSP